MSVVAWIVSCLACLVVGGFLGAFAMGVSAAATRHVLVRQIAQRDQALRAYTHPEPEDEPEDGPE